jgi:hypothetical protein
MSVTAISYPVPCCNFKPDIEHHEILNETWSAVEECERPTMGVDYHFLVPHAEGRAGRAASAACAVRRLRPL